MCPVQRLLGTQKHQLAMLQTDVDPNPHRRVSRDPSITPRQYRQDRGPRVPTWSDVCSGAGGCVLSLWVAVELIPVRHLRVASR